MAKKVPNPIDARGQPCANSPTGARHEPGKVRQRAWSHVSASEKYEKGTNRIGSSRLQHASLILQVAIAYFFEGTPGQIKAKGNAPSSALCRISRHLDGGAYSLAKAFTQMLETPRCGITRNLLVRDASSG